MIPFSSLNPSLDTSNGIDRVNATDPKKKGEVDPNDLANKEVFLQLLIAQIKNQDPSSPADSMQFITQLSQFTGVEQLVDIKNQLKILTEKLTPVVQPTPDSA